MTTDKFSLTELQSKTIDFLRFPLALMVVFIHNPLLEGINMQSINYSSFTGFDFYTIVGTFLSLTLTHIAVPCFFMFSGFLFFCKITDFTPSLYTNKLKKRALTLLIPYILWCLVPIGMSFAKAVLHDNLIGFWTKLTDKGFLSIFWNYTSWHNTVNNFTNYGPALLPLWFLRDLIISVILSPLVYYLVKHTKVWGIVALGLLYYFKVPSDFISYNINQLITALFFFSIGSYFSIHGQNLVLSFRKRQTILYIIAGVSLVLTVFCYNTAATKFLYPIYVISCVVSAVNLASYLLENNKVRSSNLLAKASFFIFLSHPVIILSGSKWLFDKILPFDNYLVLTIKYLLTPFLCVTICITVYWMLKRFVPKLTGIITGGR